MFIMVTFGCMGGLLLMSGIVWYEKYGNHRYRTAINQLFSTIAWIAIGYIVLALFPEGVRYVKGPLNESFCDFHNFMKNFFSSCFLLTLDCIVLLKYIFVFKLSNFAVVNDDLIATFLNLGIMALSFWNSVVKRISIGVMPVNYHMCAGTNPYEKLGKLNANNTNGKFNTVQILLYLSLLLHLFVFTKIFLYERKMEKKTGNINLGRIQRVEQENPNQRRNAWLRENKKERHPNLSKSIIDYTTQMLCLILIFVLHLLNFKKNTTKPDQLIEKGNMWYAYFQPAGLTIAFGTIFLAFYGRNTNIIKTIWRKILDIFRS